LSLALSLRRTEKKEKSASSFKRGWLLKKGKTEDRNRRHRAAAGRVKTPCLIKGREENGEDVNRARTAGDRCPRLLKKK